MIRNINALLIQHEGSHSETLANLTRFGVELERVTATTAMNLKDVAAVPDIIIVDAGDDDKNQQMARCANELRQSQQIEAIPVVVFGPTQCFSSFDVDAHLDCRSPANHLTLKIKQAIRLYSMKIEYKHRLQTISTFGIETTPIEIVDKSKNLRLLVVGKGERYFQLASLFKGSAQLKSIPTFAGIKTELEHNDVDCLIIDTVHAPGLTASAFKDFKFNAKFFHLPVVILQDSMDQATQNAFLQTGGCDLFDLHERAYEIVAHITSAVDAESLRLRLFDAFGSDAFLGIRDAATGLPNLKFFRCHLERLTMHSQAWNQPLTFGVFQAHPLVESGAALNNEQLATLMHQVGQTIHTLMRVEDLSTYLGDGRFVIATPNTSGLTISALIGRVSAIIKMTNFSVAGETSRIELDSFYFDNSAASTADEVMEKLRA